MAGLHLIYMPADEERPTDTNTIDSGEEAPVYQDSTWAYPVRGHRCMWFADLHIGREGFWIVPIQPDGNPFGKPRLISPLTNAVAPASLSFWIYRKANSQDLRRAELAGTREERVGKAAPGMTRMLDVSLDGREVLWARSGRRSKLGLVDNAFE